MKNYLQDNYPESMGYDQLRAAVNNTWDQVGQYEFQLLIDSMKERCEAVTKAECWITKY